LNERKDTIRREKITQNHNQTEVHTSVFLKVRSFALEILALTAISFLLFQKIVEAEDTPYRFEFGKHIGETLEEVHSSDYMYISWSIRHNVSWNKPDLRIALRQWHLSSNNEKLGGGRIGVDLYLVLFLFFLWAFMKRSRLWLVVNVM
jgi:hypothetical protein